MLYLYYTKLATNRQKQEFIRQMEGECRVEYPTVRSWIANPKAKMYRVPKKVYWPIISRITGLSEEELFGNEENAA